MLVAIMTNGSLYAMRDDGNDVFFFAHYTYVCVYEGISK